MPRSRSLRELTQKLHNLYDLNLLLCTFNSGQLKNSKPFFLLKANH